MSVIWAFDWVKVTQLFIPAPKGVKSVIRLQQQVAYTLLKSMYNSNEQIGQIDVILGKPSCPSRQVTYIARIRIHSKKLILSLSDSIYFNAV